jgi:hypothetical protein
VYARRNDLRDVVDYIADETEAGVFTANSSLPS